MRLALPWMLLALVLAAGPVDASPGEPTAAWTVPPGLPGPAVHDMCLLWPLHNVCLPNPLGGT